MATQFVLQKEINSLQALLIQEQVIKAKNEAALVAAQVANIEADTVIKAKQLLVMDAEIAQTKEQTKLVTQNILASIAQTAHTVEQTSLIAKQALQLVSQTALSNQQLINVTNENTTITKQQLKLDAEVAVLTQKKFTEQAQILDTVNGLAVAGVVGIQKVLYKQQARGFDRDSEQKLAKILVDTYTVRQTTAGGEDPSLNGVNGAEVAAVLARAKAGIMNPIT